MLKKIICFALIILALTATTITGVSAADKDPGSELTNNVLSVKDATVIQKHLAGMLLLTEDQRKAADKDFDGLVTIKDATRIQKTIAKVAIDPVEDNPDTNPPDTEKKDRITAESLRKIEEGFLRLVNEERIAKGVKPLSINKHLDNVAQHRSKELVEKFSHTRPNGLSCFSLVDSRVYPYSNVGENVGLTTVFNSSVINHNQPVNTDEFSPEEIETLYTRLFNMFKNSPGHYENMLRAVFEDTGVGITYVYEEEYDTYRIYIAHIFGRQY